MPTRVWGETHGARGRGCTIASSQRGCAERKNTGIPLDIDDGSLVTRNFDQPDTFARSPITPQGLRSPAIYDNNGTTGGYADELDFRA